MPRTHTDPDAEREPVPAPAEHERRRPLSLSDVVERLLARRVGASSSVTLSRGARGQVQIVVTVATGERDDEPPTALAAAALAREIYDALADEYPAEWPAAPAEPAAS